MTPFTRAILIVLDSVGIGELPDAAAYGDQGSNTLGHIARQTMLRIPHLRSLGLDRLGLVLDRPFTTFPSGFPADLIAEFERRIGRRILGNVGASGTEIIERL